MGVCRNRLVAEAFGSPRGKLIRHPYEDVDPRSVKYARENVSRNDFDGRINVVHNTEDVLLPESLFVHNK